MSSIDTPGDLLLLDMMLTGKETRCVEWDKVEKRIHTCKGKVYNRVVCPVGCIKTTEDAERKCGIKYYTGGTRNDRRI